MTPHSPLSRSSVRVARVQLKAQNVDPVELVAAMAEGDSEAALACFYQAYSSTVLALLMKMLGSRTEAEDILQDVFMELWRRASEFDPARGKVISWVVTVARSRALDALRKRKRREGSVQEVKEKAELITQQRPDLLASRTRWHRVLREAFTLLNEEQRAVLERSYFEGLSHGQIAEELGVPVGTVKSRILAGMRSLRTMLPLLHQGGKS